MGPLRRQEFTGPSLPGSVGGKYPPSTALKKFCPSLTQCHKPLPVPRWRDGMTLCQGLTLALFSVVWGAVSGVLAVFGKNGLTERVYIAGCV